MAAVTAAAALAGLAYGAYGQKRNKQQAKRAEEIAAANPEIDPEEQRRAIAERTARARARNAGGVSSTNKTGPGGLPTPLGSGKGSKTLLGG